MKRVLLLVMVLLFASCAQIEPEQELGQTPDSGTSTDADTDTDTDADSDTDTDTDTDTDSDTSPVECDDSEDCGGDLCVDGYCCNDACDGACEACDIAGFEGTCTSYSDGMDPEDDCSDAGPSSCGETGVCNGVSGCALFPSGVVCDDLEPCTSDDQCDGLGTCEGLAPTDCDPGAGNECCAGACSTMAGCYTVDDGCDDNCGTNNILKGQICNGCGPAAGVGICSGGSVHTCNSFSHILCEDVSCGGTTYYCTNDGGVWEWRSLVLCDDGDDCTFSDTCWGGSCIGTVYTCPSDDCTTRVCDGLGACTETHEPVTTMCGTITCPVDNCDLGSWWDYLPDCTSYCDGSGTCVDCTCSAAETVCTDGSVCCEAACLDVEGCFTVTGTCGTGDVCSDSNTMYVDSVCSGCGPMGAAGVCGGGGTFICNDTQHNSCEIVSCGGTTYYCTNETGSWQWELTPNCDDGDLCTYDDTCGAGGTCLGTPITCTDTDCLSSTCDGTSSCLDVPMTTTVACGTTTCTADYCSAGSWFNYPPACTSYCDGIGSCDPCTCTLASTVCAVGGANECCLSTCDPVLGCGTNAGNCDGTDECTDPTTLVTAKSCVGCGANLANGVCANGTSNVCDSSASCDVVTCDTDTYYCTNFGGTWEWRLGNNQCNDGDLCTYGDYCDSGSCSGTSISCIDDNCIDRSCNGTMSCTEVNLPVTTACDTTACSADYCGGGNWYDYPGTCTNYCDGGGSCNTCACTASSTACTLGVSNECCASNCDDVTGCFTYAGSCGGSDDCTDPLALVVGQSCGGCGANGATGICGGGSTLVCNATTHTNCETQTCDGATYYCTYVGSFWQWRTASGCDDGNACTYNDVCGGSTCNGTAIICSDDACHDRSCNGTASCSVTILSGNSCDDGNLCTYNETCDGSGACNGGTPITCIDDTCNNRECDGTSTCSVTYNTGVGCDDGNLCTYAETCNSSGVCTGGTPVTCISDQCHNSVCDGDSTCSVTVLTGNACNDGDSCTTGTTCNSSGTCTGGVSAAVCGDFICECDETAVSCSIDCGCADDSYEDNDTWTTAHYISEGINYAGVSDDADYYEISVTSGYELMDINLTFTDSAGDIDICLLDSGGATIVCSTSITDNEYIDYTVSSGGTYYLYVYGGNCNSYTLWWDDLLNPTIFFDDFEDGNYTGWTAGGCSNTRSVSSATAADGTTYSLYISGACATHYGGLYHLFSPTVQPNLISYWARSGSTSASDGYFVVHGSATTGTSNQMVMIYFNSDGTIRVIDGAGGFSASTYSANTWYHIEMRNINWTAHTFDFYVNGSPASTGVTFRGPISACGRIDLYNYSASSAYWDQILLQ